MSVLAATLLAAALADAVAWRAPPGCPEATTVRRRVTDLLGRSLTERDLRAEGIVHAGPPWRLELSTTIGGRHQQRRLMGDDCEEVAEAAALILAVSVDPLGVSQAAALAEPPVQSVVPEPGPNERRPGSERSSAGGSLVPTPVDAAPVDVASVDAASVAAAEEGSGDPSQIESRSALGPGASPQGPGPPASTGSEQGPERGLDRSGLRRLWLRLGLGGELGAVPRGTGGVRLGLGIEGARAHLRLEGGYWIDRIAELRAQPRSIGARIGLGTVMLAGGVTLGGPRVVVPLSLGLEAGGLRSRGVGLSQPRALTFPWLAGVVGVGVQVGFGRRLAAWGRAEAFVPMVRPSVRVGQGSDETELYRTAALGARVLLGVAVRLGRS